MTETRPVTFPDLAGYKRAGRRIVVLTCYDAPFARLLDLKEGDILLLDTAEEGTLPVTVQGRPKLRGTPAVVGGSMALVVEAAMAPEQAVGIHPAPVPPAAARN